MHVGNPGGNRLVVQSMAFATLSNSGRYSRFSYNGRTISFMHGKDLLEYLRVKEWKDGYLVVDCLGRVKGQYCTNGFGLKRMEMNMYRTEKNAPKMAALELFVQNGASVGYCAQMAGMTEEEFIRFLGEKGIGIFHFDSEEELLSDV